MPLIVVLILICVMPTIIIVRNGITRPQETAEINKEVEQEEQISAETTTVEAGETYTVPKDGLYKIELHGGKSQDLVMSDGTISGWQGDKVTGYVNLKKDDSLNVLPVTGGKNLLEIYSQGTLLHWTGLGAGMGIALELNGVGGFGTYGIAFASGGPGMTLNMSQNSFFCANCGYVQGSASQDALVEIPGRSTKGVTGLENRRTVLKSQLEYASVNVEYVLGRKCEKCGYEKGDDLNFIVYSGGHGYKLMGASAGFPLSGTKDDFASGYVERNNYASSVEFCSGLTDAMVTEGGSGSTSAEGYAVITLQEWRLNVDLDNRNLVRWIQMGQYFDLCDW